MCEDEMIMKCFGADELEEIRAMSYELNSYSACLEAICGALEVVRLRLPEDALVGVLDVQAPFDKLHKMFCADNPNFWVGLIDATKFLGKGQATASSVLAWVVWLSGYLIDELWSSSLLLGAKFSSDESDDSDQSDEGESD